MFVVTSEGGGLDGKHTLIRPGKTCPIRASALKTSCGRGGRRR